MVILGEVKRNVFERGKLEIEILWYTLGGKEGDSYSVLERDSNTLGRKIKREKIFKVYLGREVKIIL